MNLIELISTIWKHKVFLSIFSGFFAVASIIISLSIPNEYLSETILAPANNDDDGGLASLAGGLGGLASLAGINLGGSSNNTVLAATMLKSRSFAVKFVERHHLLIPLMATEGWDDSTDELIINDKIYDESSKEWVRDVDYPITKKPMNFEIYEAFKKRFHISKNKTTGFYTLSFEFYSPSDTQLWLSWIISDINEEIRNKEIQEAQKSIFFLKKKIEETDILEMKTTFSSLIEEQTKTMMLASVREEYVFKLLDPPYLPEEKNSPKRALIVIISTFLGGILGLLMLFSPWRKQLAKGKVD